MESELQGIDHLSTYLKSIKLKGRDSEYWEFLLMLGFGNSTKTEQLYKTLRNDIQLNDWRLPLLEIGEARIMSISGQDFESHKRLVEASKLIFSHQNFLNESIQSEITALYYYVLTSHHEKIGHYLSALPYLLMGKNLTSIDTFELAFDYRIAVNQAKWVNFPVSNVISNVKSLEKNGLWTLACIGYRAAAILSRIRNDFKSTYKYYNSAIRIANKMNLTVNLKQLKNALGFALYKENKLDEAEQVYKAIIIEGDYDPILPMLNENLALLAKARSDIDKSIDYMKNALKVSTKLDAIPNVPGEFHYLGQTYENHFKDHEQAEYYYRQGYEHAIRYASHGISLTGDRKDVVDAYVRFIGQKRPSKPLSGKQDSVDRFAFSQGKPWKDIKDIFQHQLICYHHKIQPNSKVMAAKLNMPASTLYSLQDRLKKRGYQLPEKTNSSTTENHSLFNFIEEHEELSWDAINSIFEREIIHYLYEKYGYNKQRMAQILKLSYPSIITKTRELTQVSEHLLPN